MADKKVSILLQLVDKASRDFDRIAGGFQSTAQKMSNTFSGMVKDAELGSAAFTAAFGVFSKKVINAASDAELFRKSIEFLLDGSKESTDQFIKQINDLATETFFSIDQLEEFGKRLLGVTNDSDFTIEALRNMADAVSATGGGYSELEGATRALFQTFIKGTPSLEELNRQFTNASIPALRVLAEQLHAGTVELNGYSVTSRTVAGATKEQAKAFEKASGSLEQHQLRLSAAEKRLQSLKDSGKEGSAAWDNAQASLIGYQQKVAGAAGAIENYNKANENAGQVVSTHKKSVEEIMSDLQGIADLGVTGADTARALSKALGIAFGGASQDMMQTFSGQMEQAGENLTFFMRALVGINQDNTLRDGSIFQILRDALFQFNLMIDPLIPKVGDFVDSLLKNKWAVLALTGAIVGMMLPALFAFIGFIAPAIKFGAVISGLAVAFGFLAQNLQTVMPIITGLSAAVGVLALAKLPYLIQFLTLSGQMFLFNLGGVKGLITAIATFATGVGGLAVVIGLTVAGLTAWAIKSGALLTKQQQVNIATNNLIQARKDLKIATDELTAAEDRTRSAMIQEEGAQLALERATQNLTEVKKIYGEGSLEVREAVHQEKLAEDNLEQAKKRTTEAAEKEIEAQQNFIEQTGEVENAAQKRVDALSKEENAWDRIWGSIGNAVNKLKEYFGLRGSSKEGAPDLGNAFQGAAQHGMVVPGNPTQAVPIIAHGGERIIPRSGVDVNPMGGGGGGGGASINFYGPVNMDSEQRVQQLADQIIKKLGRQNELARLGVGF